MVRVWEQICADSSDNLEGWSLSLLLNIITEVGEITNLGLSVAGDIDESVKPLACA